jgi:hypothetical protein
MASKRHWASIIVTFIKTLVIIKAADSPHRTCGVQPLLSFVSQPANETTQQFKHVIRKWELTEVFTALKLWILSSGPSIRWQLKLHLQMGPTRSSEILVTTSKITWRKDPEDHTSSCQKELLVWSVNLSDWRKAIRIRTNGRNRRTATRRYRRSRTN